MLKIMDRLEWKFSNGGRLEDIKRTKIASLIILCMSVIMGG